MSWEEAAIVGGGALLGGFFGGQAAKSEGKADRQWREYMAETSVQRRAIDMKKAGINPILANKFDSSAPGASSYGRGAATVGGAQAGATMATASQQMAVAKQEEIGKQLDNYIKDQAVVPGAENLNTILRLANGFLDSIDNPENIGEKAYLFFQKLFTKAFKTYDDAVNAQEVIEQKLKNLPKSVGTVIQNAIESARPHGGGTSVPQTESQDIDERVAP